MPLRQRWESHRHGGVKIVPDVSINHVVNVRNLVCLNATFRVLTYAQSVTCLSFFARLCSNVRYLSKFCYQAVLKFSFQLFNYKSFIFDVNETKQLN